MNFRPGSCKILSATEMIYKKCHYKDLLNIQSDTCMFIVVLNQIKLRPKTLTTFLGHRPHQEFKFTFNILLNL